MPSFGSLIHAIYFLNELWYLGTFWERPEVGMRSLLSASMCCRQSPWVDWRSMKSSVLSKLTSKMVHRFVQLIEAFRFYYGPHNRPLYSWCLPADHRGTDQCSHSGLYRPPSGHSQRVTWYRNSFKRWMTCIRHSNSGKFSDRMCFLELFISILNSIVLKKTPFIYIYI